MNSAYDRLKIF